MYKVGDKVETPLGVGKLVDISLNNETKFKVAYGTRTTWYAHDEIKPYKTAHEKLIELGWEEIDNDKIYVVYRKTTLKNTYHDNYIQLEIIKRTKTFGAIKYNNDNFSSHRSHHQFNFDLELSRILTQYLEELEE